RWPLIRISPNDPASKKSGSFIARPPRPPPTILRPLLRGFRLLVNFNGLAGRNRDRLAALAAVDPAGFFVPDDDVVLAGRRALDLELAVGVGDGEVRMVEHPHPTAHRREDAGGDGVKSW